MEIRQLEYFKEIDDTGSINEAARRLNMSQPPLSSQLRRLEDELNVRLFERTKKGVSLTEAGKLLYTHAERILDYTRSAAIEVSNAEKRQILRLGLTHEAKARADGLLRIGIKADRDLRMESLQIVSVH